MAGPRQGDGGWTKGRTTPRWTRDSRVRRQVPAERIRRDCAGRAYCEGFDRHRVVACWCRRSGSSSRSTSSVRCSWAGLTMGCVCPLGFASGSGLSASRRSSWSSASGGSPRWCFRPSLTDVALGSRGPTTRRRPGSAACSRRVSNSPQRAHEEGVTGTLKSEEVALDAARRSARSGPRPRSAKWWSTSFIGGPRPLTRTSWTPRSTFARAVHRHPACPVALGGASGPSGPRLPTSHASHAHPLGACLPLRASAAPRPRCPVLGQTDVSVKYRLEVNGSGGLCGAMPRTSQRHQSRPRSTGNRRGDWRTL